jgi:hypothetical protein
MRLGKIVPLAHRVTARGELAQASQAYAEGVHESARLYEELTPDVLTLGMKVCRKWASLRNVNGGF